MTSQLFDQSQQRFQSAFESDAMGMALVRFDGTWLDVNQSLCHILGYTEEELRRRSLEDIIHPDDLDIHRERMHELLDGTSSRYLMERRCIHKQGHVVWVAITAARLVQRHDLPLSVILHMEDITDRKQVEGALRTIAAERAATLESVRHYALHDALTDLPNRVLLLDRLDQTILMARRQFTSFVLLFLDLDRFKQVNDTLGHSAGDLLLQQVAHRLRETMRESDTIARMGGDEFAVILPQVDRHGAHLVALKILEALAAPFSLNGIRVHVGVSIGVAAYPEHGETSGLLMQRADVAMYVAKRERLGYATYSPTHDVNTPSRLALAAELRQAIEEGQLVLHYQPKIDLRVRRMRGVEALIRWLHPDHGLIPPSEFIPVAEQAGFITPLSHWVIDAALDQCRVWQDMGIGLLTAINLSASNLQEEETVTHIIKQLGKRDVDPGLLEVEITETAIMDDPERSVHALTRLHHLGVRIALDDFGIGYSSLAHLARLPIHVSKIDRSFVLELEKTERDRSATIVVRSMIDLSHSLGLQVVAEGIETKETLEVLTALQCDLAQGFYLCPPIPAPDIPAQWAVMNSVS